MKKAVLQSIYKSFASWAEQFTVSCRKGCALCCTRDVMASAVEAEMINDHLIGQSREAWLVSKLQCDLPRIRPSSTINEYAQACLSGIELDPSTASNGGVCPFLENSRCSIYSVRPFSCRSFASVEMCKPGSSAVIPPYYLSAVEAVNQIIEHLSQHYFWGNMLHLVYLLAQQNTLTADTDYPDNKKRLLLAQTSCLTAQPLPGFLICEGDFPYVEPLIRQIFSVQLQGKSIEDILNNR